MPSRKSSRARSIRFRVTALFMAIFGATLVVFGAILYVGFDKGHQASFDSALYNHAVELLEELRGGLNLAPSEGTPRTDPFLSPGKIFPFSVEKALVQVLDPERRIVVKSTSLAHSQLPVYDEDWNKALKTGTAFSTVPGHEIFANRSGARSDYRLLTYLVRDGDGPPHFAFQVAVPTTHLEHATQSLFWFFVGGVPVVLLIAALGGLYLSGRALAPVSAIIASAKQLSPRNLTERIPVPTANDELRQLSLTLNHMLDRLQQGFDSQERFIADASHELKTPLAILHNDLDELADSAASPERVAETLASASQEVHHLIRLVEDLLVLARIGAGSACLVIQPLRLDELLLEVTGRLDRVARPKNIRIKMNLITTAEAGPSPDFETAGDPVLLQILFKNILENAIKFSIDGTAVEIEAQRRREMTIVTIRDHGPGMEPDVLPHIFDRFYRAKNSSGVAGSGLGLAIAKQIADIHDINLTVESVVGIGTAFRAEIKNA